MKSSNRVSLAAILLIVATFIELGYQTFWLNAYGIYWNPIIWLLGGLFCCIFAINLIRKQANENEFNPLTNVMALEEKWVNKWMNGGVYWFVFFACSFFIATKLQGIFDKYPIDPLASDVIPSMQMYVQRFLAGEKVYAEMYFPSWSFFPTYLPFMWSPYIIAEFLNLDYRWIAYFFFIIVLIFWNRRLLSQPIYFEEALFKLVLPFIFLKYFIQYTDHVFGHAIELTPISYYLLLALSLGSKRVWVLALPIVFCLLSRYAFSFWLPIYGLILWKEYGFKKIFQVGFLSFLGLFVFYLVPFVIGDWEVITKGAAAYNTAIIGQWQTQPWQEAGAIPNHLGKGLSFSIYFYSFFPDLSIVERLSINKWVHLLVSLGTAIFILISYFWCKKKYANFNLKLFLLIALKFYLVIFYSLLYMPFSYLYQLPLFLSIPIIYETRILKIGTSNFKMVYSKIIQYFPFISFVAGCAIIISTAQFYPKWEKTGTEATLSWDVMGYYLYLPAAFIYKDLEQLEFKDDILNKYHPTGTFYQAYPNEKTGKQVMKYPIGLAMLYTPFFLVGHAYALMSDYPPDGFSLPYQAAISWGSILFAFIGLWFCQKALRKYFDSFISGVVVLLIAIATNYLNYTAIDGAMAHNWGFTLYAMLIYGTIKWYEKPSYQKSILVGACIAFATLARPTNILSVLIPIFWGIQNYAAFQDRLGLFKTYWKQLLTTAITVLLIGSIQLIYWKYITDDWIFYTYNEQGFSWFKPHIKNVLISFKKGWLIYTPIMILALIGFRTLFKKYKTLFPFCLGFFLLNFYIVAAWDVWGYGGAFGQRALIESYTILAFPMAALLAAIQNEKWTKWFVFSFSIFCIWLNVFQTWQAHGHGF